jgi:hypothetical protein
VLFIFLLLCKLFVVILKNNKLIVPSSVPLVWPLEKWFQRSFCGVLITPWKLLTGFSKGLTSGTEEGGKQIGIK